MSSQNNFQVAVLTVSDTASKNAEADKSGPTIKTILSTSVYTIVDTKIVPDEEEEIKNAVKGWSEAGIQWIITTGGTGFGLRDRTPEAIKPLLDRDAPGIVHLLLSTSLKHTPLAALSRPVAGTIRDSNTLVTTLPGSVKAVKENLGALLDAGFIAHALDLLAGGSGKGVHKALAEGKDPSGELGSSAHVHHHDHSHEHHHHHHHHDHGHQSPKHDLIFSASSRHRVSPYEIISYEEAMRIILREVPQMDVVKAHVAPSLKGTILAEDVFAPYDIPTASTTNMDGYAVRSSDAPGVYRVLTSQTHALHETVPVGYIYRINTGAPLPAGTDSVVIVEQTELVSSTDDHEESEVRTLVEVSPGENVRAPGSDVHKGDMVLKRGEAITGIGGEIGTLIFVGRSEVRVYRKPVVAIMSTGNELVDLHHTPSDGYSSNEEWTGVWDTNRPSLQAALETLGYSVIDLGIVKDNLEAHKKTLEDGLRRADLVLTTGGTSMGSSDLLKPVIENHLNGKIHFGRVSIKPGKPTTFATVVSDRGNLTKPIFALPGNPASALVCFYVFVLPALRRMSGITEEHCQLPRVVVEIQDQMILDPRTEFHRVIVSMGQTGLIARSTGGQRSSRIASLSNANGLVILPQKREGGPEKLNAGERAIAIIIGELQSSEKL